MLKTQFLVMIMLYKNSKAYQFHPFFNTLHAIKALLNAIGKIFHAC